jgi:hypothetical protein
MPEQITKHPDVTLEVLKSAGAKCGEGAPQQILKKCPAERFCALPGGEMCVYGLDQIPQMTQITTQELARTVCPPGRDGAALIPEGLSWTDATALGATFAIGLAIGWVARPRQADRAP